MAGAPVGLLGNAWTVTQPEPPETGWLHDRVEVRPSPIEGKGLFATAALAEGIVVLRLGGRLVSTAELTALVDAAAHDPAGLYIDTITVYEDAHLVLPAGSAAHFGNHSCDPNLWHAGPYDLVSRRAIHAGEELTIDYATNSGLANFTMTCRCGSTLCRGTITGNDWQRDELRNRYGNHWVPALQDRIRRR
jgi:uncharacterized protein